MRRAAYIGDFKVGIAQLQASELEYVTVVGQDVKHETEASSSDLSWMGEYKRAATLFDHTVLPADKAELMYTRVFRQVWSRASVL